ncbi:DUF4157 domain-containing protein [Bradyrhizobium liaoningense]|uniref:eCIS core domain-containing protein n=1 Tax=Bradyrhizobium liaoningense TaxID=43992 RepID=UPI001BA83F3F|nr:DUF4157 domain-containing protein [Bradyrhizobium liaoningense]MBR0713557.1 DUF4157 domain-containing protein [Bradyrhizobium liaoningense]
MTTVRIRLGSQRTSSPASAVTSPAWNRAQRKSAGKDESATLQPDAGHAVEQALDSPARSLDNATRAEMQGRLGHDFGDVRIHTGHQAEASARAVHANAYTFGRDIVFGPGRYAPHALEGQRLLAHELTHVVQQALSSGPHARPQRLGAFNDALEAEADRATEGIGRPSFAATPTRLSAPSPVVQRDGPAKDAKPAASKASGYPTAWQAAHAALAICNPKSIKSKDPTNILSSGNEYGGLIYKIGDEFFFTEAVVGQGAGGESAAVDPWLALDKVPEAAKHSIVGDYHTHGAPPDPRRDPRERIKDPGEDFSGHHADVDPLSKTVITGTEKKTGDIWEVRDDLTKHKASILNPETYTAFLATPTGRFTLFIPKKNIVFSFSPDPRLLPPDQKPQAASYAH